MVETLNPAQSNPIPTSTRATLLLAVAAALAVAIAATVVTSNIKLQLITRLHCVSEVQIKRLKVTVYCVNYKQYCKVATDVVLSADSISNITIIVTVIIVIII